jgi:hypothetical protein
MTNKEDIRALTDTGGCEGGVEGPPCSDRPPLLMPDAARCDAPAEEQPSLYFLLCLNAGRPRWLGTWAHGRGRLPRHVVPRVRFGSSDNGLFNAAVSTAQDS